MVSIRVRGILSKCPGCPGCFALLSYIIFHYSLFSGKQLVKIGWTSWTETITPYDSYSYRKSQVGQSLDTAWTTWTEPGQVKQMISFTQVYMQRLYPLGAPMAPMRG